jgi:hypothetical protein
MLGEYRGEPAAPDQSIAAARSGTNGYRRANFIDRPRGAGGPADRRRLSNKEFARQLKIGLGTTKSHVHNVLGKLELKRRSQVGR